MNNYLMSHAASGNEGLSESLNFTAPAMAGYARRRQHRTLPPLGGAEYGLQGSGKTTTMRYRISGDEFLDCSTMAIKFKVSNAGANPVWMSAPAYCFFNRLRILVNGYSVEEIQDFHRTCSLIDACSSRDAVYNQKAKQGWFGDMIGVGRDETFVVPFRASGLFNNFGNKFLPLKYIPQLDIELELASLDEAVLATKVIGASAAVTAANITISDVRLMYDSVMLDSSVEDQFYKHLEGGGTLDIPFATWRNTRQMLTASSFAVQTSCNVKSARSIFFSVIKNNGTTTNAEDKEIDAAGTVVDTGLAAMNATSGAAGQFYKHGIRNFELQIGSNVFPDSPVSSTAEFHHYLSVAWNKHHTYSDPLGITWQEYNNDLSGPYTPSVGLATTDYSLVELGPYPTVPAIAAATTNAALNPHTAARNYGSRFIVGFNLERLLDMWASGLSLDSEIIQIKGDCKSQHTNVQGSIMLHYNAILRIGKGVVDVLERA